MAHRSVVAVWLLALVVSGLTAVMPTAAAAGPSADPGVLEFEDVPLVPAVPLGTPDYQTAESDRSPSIELPHDAGDLPGDESAQLEVEESWSELPETPVEVRVAESSPDNDAGQNETDNEPEDVSAGDEITVEIGGSEDPTTAAVVVQVSTTADETPVETPPVDPPVVEPSGTPESDTDPDADADIEPQDDGDTAPADQPAGSPQAPQSDSPSEDIEPSQSPTPDPEVPDGDGSDLPAPVVAAAGVEVRISYADFGELYGGGWAERLEVVAHPECFLTTPEAEGCADRVPVASMNDPAGQTVTFTTLDAEQVAESAEPLDSLSEVGESVVYALAAGEGKFDAVPLNSATSWQAGTGSGEFTYGYPFEMPAALGGPTPSLSLSYSSAMVDTMAAQTAQGTAVGLGWSDLSPGAITRSYAVCEDDHSGGDFDDRGDSCWKTRDTGTPEETVVEELSLSMNGRSSRLRLIAPNVDDGDPDVITDEFRLYDDPGWRVVRSSNATSNPSGLLDDDRERWVVTTPDGIEYHFGHRAAQTSSVWTVPVFGNDPGEPCYSATLADAWCYQAWQWNLDRVVDRLGNETHYTYTNQTNRYDRFGPADNTSGTLYHRAGNLTGLEYGFRHDGGGALGPARQKVEITTAPRCLPALSNPSASCPLTGAGSDSAQWPDVPFDLICETGPCTQQSPSFFSTRRYHQVKTFTMRGTGTGTQTPVNTYTFGHTLPDADGRTIENTDPNEVADLWLQSVQVTGHVGGASTTVPRVWFEGQIYDNKVAPASSAESVEKFRIFAVRNELGGRIDVTYGHQRGCDGPYVSGRDRWDSDRECFAARNIADTAWEWFHKYVVTRVALSDDALHYRVGHADPAQNLGSVQVFDYDYTGTGAWRYGASRNLNVGQESWNDWRGYEQTLVRSKVVTNQVPTTGNHSVTRTVRYRGMNNSRINAAGDQYQNRRVDTVEPDDGDPGPLDEPWLNGLVAETSVEQPNGNLIERTYTSYGTFGLDAKEGQNLARRVWTDRTTTTTSLRNDAGTITGNRRHTVTFGVYDGGTNHRGVMAGAPRWTWDQGAESTNADDTCVLVQHATNLDEWMVAESDSRLHDSGCGSDGNPAGPMVAHTEKFYDAQQTTPAAPLTAGLLTKQTVHTGPNPGTNPATDDVPATVETDYDDYGRVIETRNPRGKRTLTEYNPTGSGAGAGDLVVGLKTTQLNSTGPNPTTTSTLEPARGLPTLVVDPNGGQTKMTYDGLGRPLAMFTPRNTSSTPTIEHVYRNELRVDENSPLTMDKPARVTTYTKLGGPNATTRRATNTFYDGWGHVIETQEVSPTAGRRLATSTGYDDRGLPRFATGPYSSTGGTVGEIINPAPSTVPRYSLTSYDAASRPTTVEDRTLNSSYRTSTTAYLGNGTLRVPAGSGATRTVLDVWDRPTKVELHHNAAGTDIEDSADYTYTARGELDTITKTLSGTGTDAWEYDYDWAGRKIEAIDPDTGRTEYTYDPAGNLVENEAFSNTSGTQQSRILTEFDDLNRPTIRKDATGILALAPTTLASWTYDTATNGIGKPATTTSTTHISTLIPGILPPGSVTSWNHTQQVNSYDADGNPTQTQVRYPSWLTGETANAGGGNVGHTFNQTYDAVGDPDLTTLPQTPGFAAPIPITHTYEPTGGRLATMRVGTTTLADATYDAIGQPRLLSSYNTTANTLIRSYEWTEATGLPQRVTATRTGPGTTTAPGTTNPLTGLDLQYQYDLADNPLRVTGAYQTPGGSTPVGAWCYSYDGLNRLTRALNGTPSTGTSCTKPTPGSAAAISVEAVTGPLHDLGYTFAEDRLKAVRTPGTGTATGTVTYNYANEPHQASNLAGTGTTTGVPGMPPTGPITYDGLGRANSQPGSPTINYDNQGNPTRSVGTGTGATVNRYAYDANGNRIARQTANVTNPTQILTTTIYLPNGTEVTNNTGTGTPYEPTGLSSTHVITTPGGTPIASILPTATLWTHADSAQTIRLTQTPGGTQTRPTYYPHGTPTTPPRPETPARRGYLNKPHDPNGDIRLDQRNYTPNLNVLTTPDPTFQPADPQSANPYTYARNNPITLADPSGLAPNCVNGINGTCDFKDNRVTNFRPDDSPAPIADAGPPSWYDPFAQGLRTGPTNGRGIPDIKPPAEAPWFVPLVASLVTNAGLAFHTEKHNILARELSIVASEILDDLPEGAIARSNALARAQGYRAMAKAFRIFGRGFFVASVGVTAYDQFSRDDLTLDQKISNTGFIVGVSVAASAAALAICPVTWGAGCVAAGIFSGATAGTLAAYGVGKNPIPSFNIAKGLQDFTNQFLHPSVP